MPYMSKKRKFATLASFLLPGLALYSFFLVFQIIEAFRLSTFRWDSIVRNHFVGLDNYRWLLSNPSFWNSLKLTMIYMVVTTIGALVIGFTFGYFVYLGVRGFNFFRVCYFIPTVLSSVAVAYIWKYLYSPSIGLTKGLMDLLGFGSNVSPLGIKNTAFPAEIFVQMWCSIGVQIMMFNSAFNGISEDVLEYAAMEGCTGWKLVYHMVIPLSWDVIRMIIILRVIDAFRAFDLIFVMTGGGPYHSTEILPMYMYLTAFENMDFGEGNAIAVAIFILSMLMTVILRRLLTKKDQ